MNNVGILHFGPGAFHRAHQAAYIDSLLADDPRWGVAAASLRSGGTIESLRRQDGRYTLAILDAEPRLRTIRSHRRWFGPGEEAALRRQFADRAIRIVSSTVTEKGYCLAGDGTLDFGHPDIVHDLADPIRPISVVGWLALGLADRRAAGLPAFTALCCDNLASNGRKLEQAVIAFAGRLDRDLVHWIAGEARFPNTMVDSITPATTNALRQQVKAQTGFADEIPVARESYAAWVIEDMLPAGGPDLASVGVVLTSDVAAWERAKLRILNGAHSSFAYLGLLRGHETVADAMADAPLANFVERMLVRDIVPSLRPSPLDLDKYAAEILERFRNPAIGHKLAQIAWDGSQKLPYRLLDTVQEALAADRSIERLAAAIAGWLLFVERQARAGIEIIDPLGSTLAACGARPDSIEALLDLRQVFPRALADNPIFRTAILTGVDRLRTAGSEPLVNDTGFL